jgi:sugar lactone lactonase YvrE
MKILSKISIMLLSLLACGTFSCKKELAPISVTQKNAALSSDSVGSVTTFISNNQRHNALTFDAAHNLYTASDPANRYDFDGPGAIYKITPAAIISFLANGGDVATGITYGPDSVLYFTNGSVITKITLSGVVTTFAGGQNNNTPNYGPLAQATFGDLIGITTCADGNLYIADQQNQDIRVITPGGIVYTLAGHVGAPFAIAIHQGIVYFSDYNAGTIGKIALDGTVSTFATRFAAFGLAIDPSGNLYASDNTNNKIWKITPNGVVSLLAGSGIKVSVDGVGANASFNDPRGLAIDGDILYVTDYGVYGFNVPGAIRKIKIK